MMFVFALMCGDKAQSTFLFFSAFRWIAKANHNLVLNASGVVRDYQYLGAPWLRKVHFSCCLAEDRLVVLRVVSA